MNRKIKQEKAITLIALVITIIVLLILAAISIATLTGENGILTKATNAKAETIKAQEKEQIELAYLSAQTKKMSNGSNEAITSTDLNEEFNNSNVLAEAQNDSQGGMKVTFRETKNEYSIDSKGKVTGPTNTEGTEEAEKTDGSYIEGKGVNSPQLLSGMTKIMFTDPTDTAKGEMIKEG